VDDIIAGSQWVTDHLCAKIGDTPAKYADLCNVCSTELVASKELSDQTIDQIMSDNRRLVTDQDTIVQRLNTTRYEAVAGAQASTTEIAKLKEALRACRAGEVDRFKAVIRRLKDSATKGHIVQDTVLDVGSLRSDKVFQLPHYTV
jgi:hypothetical protein